MTMSHSNFVISHRPHLFTPIQHNILPESVEYFDGTGYPSFSKLVNSCVASANTETVIIMSDKVMPRAADVQRLLGLLDQGYAFVALYRLAFSGFRKQLLREIGMFDERFVGGGYEDDDFYIRLKEANLASYITEEVEYAKSKSTWNYGLAQGHFHHKWGGDVKHSGIATRQLGEETYNYCLGPDAPVKYLPWSHSVITARRAKRYQDVTIK